MTDKVFMVFSYDDDDNLSPKGVYSTREETILACLDETYSYVEAIPGVSFDDQDVKWTIPCGDDEE